MEISTTETAGSTRAIEADERYLKVAHAPAGCQLIEQELKLYITEALELVKKCIGGRMPFRISDKDHADSSLERLITTFEKPSDNQALVRELAKFKEA